MSGEIKNNYLKLVKKIFHKNAKSVIFLSILLLILKFIFPISIFVTLTPILYLLLSEIVVSAFYFGFVGIYSLGKIVSNEKTIKMPEIVSEESPELKMDNHYSYPQHKYSKPKTLVKAYRKKSNNRF